jgi:signal transduction histidine kinase
MTRRLLLSHLGLTLLVLLCLEIPLGYAGQVLAVPGAVEQILDNLLSNALRVSPQASTVVIELRRQASPERRFPHHFPHYRAQGPGRVELHVIDEGPGMTEEQRRRAFDRFWRAPGAPKGGTGLGLALVQRLALACGGDVTLRPAPGGGLDAVVVLVPTAHDRAAKEKEKEKDWMAPAM